MPLGTRGVPCDVGTRVQARWRGVVLADSARTRVVEGNHDSRPESLRRELLALSDRRSLCPWRGRASYDDAVVAGEVDPAAGPYSPEPWPPARKIRDHVAFWNGVEVAPVGTPP